MSETTTPEKEIKSELYGTGIPVRSQEQLQDGDLPTGLTVVVGGSAQTVAVSFQRKNVGYIIRSTGTKGDDVWQARDIDTITSKDLHRVVFELASLHPPLN